MAGPLEQFDVKPIIPLEIGGLDVSFTNASLFMALVAGGMSTLLIAGINQKAAVPGRLQSLVEMTYGFIAAMVRDNIGSEGKTFFPFVFALFLFVLGCNLVGMIPGSFTVTSHLAVTFAFAALIFLATIVIGFARHGLRWLGLFLPGGTPLLLAPLIIVIEIISFLSRPITHSVRLFANMTAGHILLKVFAGFVVSLVASGGFLAALGILPFAMNIALTALEVIVAVVQAYVFALLTCVYLNDAVHLHH